MMSDFLAKRDDGDLDNLLRKKLAEGAFPLDLQPQEMAGIFGTGLSPEQVQEITARALDALLSKQPPVSIIGNQGACIAPDVPKPAEGEPRPSEREKPQERPPRTPSPADKP
jgi:hypothetical protein